MIIEDKIFLTEPDRSLLGIAQDPDAQNRLFEQIRNYLLNHGVSVSLALGTHAQHEEFSLMCVDGYWVVSFSERGQSFPRGIFWSFVEATDFLLSRILDRNRYEIDYSGI